MVEIKNMNSPCFFNVRGTTTNIMQEKISIMLHLYKGNAQSKRANNIQDSFNQIKKISKSEE